jgi:ribosome-binding factor A
MNRRAAQLASAIDTGLREILSRGLHDPRVRGLITITDVQVSNDLEHADIGITVLPAENQALALHGLRAAAQHLRRELESRVRARSIPALRFHLDETVRRQTDLLRALDEASADLKAREQRARDPNQEP